MGEVLVLLWEKKPRLHPGFSALISSDVAWFVASRARKLPGFISALQGPVLALLQLRGSR